MDFVGFDPPVEAVVARVFADAVDCIGDCAVIAYVRGHGTVVGVCGCHVIAVLGCEGRADETEVKGSPPTLVTARYFFGGLVEGIVDISAAIGVNPRHLELDFLSVGDRSYLEHEHVLRTLGDTDFAIKVGSVPIRGGVESVASLDVGTAVVNGDFVTVAACAVIFESHIRLLGAAEVRISVFLHLGFGTEDVVKRMVVVVFACVVAFF